MKIIKIVLNRYFLLISILTGFLISCSFNQEVNNKSTKALETKSQVNRKSETDSLLIGVSLPGRKSIIINYVNADLQVVQLEFINESTAINVISKRIKKPSSIFMLHYLGLVFDNGTLISFDHDYLIDDSRTKLDLQYLDSGDIKVLNSSPEVIIDDLVNSYKELVTFLNKSKISSSTFDERIKELKEKKYPSESWNMVSELLYMEAISNLGSTKEAIIGSYLTKLENYIFCISLNELLKANTRNQFTECDFNTKLETSKSAVYNQLFNKAAYNYLISIKNKNKTCFEEGVNWFYTTGLYKSNTSYYDKELRGISSAEMSRRLSQMKVTKPDSTKISLQAMLDESNASIYILDFWATWCSPCIEDYKIVMGMELPKAVEIINLSIDLPTNFKGWKNKVNQLGQRKSFLIDETPENRELIKNLEINEIPRYILIDKHSKIIQYEFLRPIDAKFEVSLNEILTNLN